MTADVDFLTTTTARFRDSLTAMLAARSDTFSFELALSDIPGWEMRAEAEKAGLAADTVMTVIVLVRPKEVADPMLEAMMQMRGADAVEMPEFDAAAPVAAKSIG